MKQIVEIYELLDNSRITRTELSKLNFELIQKKISQMNLFKSRNVYLYIRDFLTQFSGSKCEIVSLNNGELQFFVSKDFDFTGFQYLNKIISDFICERLEYL